jgi:hypothetical protein
MSNLHRGDTEPRRSQKRKVGKAEAVSAIFGNKGNSGNRF